jgi:dihydroorotate dehydrogenase (fumarate)
MVNLITKYMGLELKNPIIAGASNMMEDIENIKIIEQSGAAAIIYKSLFEEEIQLESLQLQESIEEYDDRNAMMIDTFPNMQHRGPAEYLFNLREIKKTVNIPVIASLNAVNRKTWVEYAKKIEQTGVDGLELNLYFSPTSASHDSVFIEDRQLDIIRKVRQNVKIPISLKLSYFYTNPLNIISKMDNLGVDGFVLFNRLFEPDIDLNKEEHSNPFNLSNRGDNKLPMRFAGLLYKEIKADICGSTGIFKGEDVVKMILSGASCIQCVSILYKNGIENISKMLEEIKSWMEEKGYQTLEDFKGKLAKKSLKNPFSYGRAQYLDILTNNERIIRKRDM